MAAPSRAGGWRRLAERLQGSARALAMATTTTRVPWSVEVKARIAQVFSMVRLFCSLSV
jgi:hypothetical protein